MNASALSPRLIPICLFPFFHYSMTTFLQLGVFQIKIQALGYMWITQANYTVNSLTTLGARESGRLREVAGRLREKSRK